MGLRSSYGGPYLWRTLTPVLKDTSPLIGLVICIVFHLQTFNSYQHNFSNIIAVNVLQSVVGPEILYVRGPQTYVLDLKSKTLGQLSLQRYPAVM